jgi:hypothetical protein
MHRRRNIVERSCQQFYPKDERSRLQIAAEKIFAMIRRRLAWCPVYKAGSTNWMKNLVKLSHHSPQHIAMVAARKRFGQSNTLARCAHEEGKKHFTEQFFRAYLLIEQQPI